MVRSYIKRLTSIQPTDIFIAHPNSFVNAQNKTIMITFCPPVCLSVLCPSF